MGTVEILLTKGKAAIIDEADFQLVSQYQWNCKTNTSGTFYAVSASHRLQFVMHRLIMNPPEGTDIDHRDGNGLNNTRSNLRLCTRQQNTMNRRKLKAGVSQYKGVRRSGGGAANPWRAAIKLNQVEKHLGMFGTECEAAKAYDAAARELFGEFARLNFPT